MADDPKPQQPSSPTPRPAEPNTVQRGDPPAEVKSPPPPPPLAESNRLQGGYSDSGGAAEGAGD